MRRGLFKDIKTGKMKKNRTAVNFTLKNGKYITASCEEITTEMLLKNPHEIKDGIGVISLSKPENLCLTCPHTNFCRAKGIHVNYICGDHPQHLD
jgi:hypothetical protein